MHPSSLQHPYVHSTRFQTRSYAQTQQLAERSFLKVAIFQIYVLFSAEILMPSSGFSSGSWHSHTIFIFVQFIFYLLLDTDISKRKRERSQRISRLLQDTVKSSGLRYSQYLRPSHQAPPTRQTASIRTGSLPFLPWLHHLFVFFRFTSLYLENAMYVCNRIKEIINDGKHFIFWTDVFFLMFGCVRVNMLKITIGIHLDVSLYSWSTHNLTIQSRFL